jgi:hypothetical protein
VVPDGTRDRWRPPDHELFVPPNGIHVGVKLDPAEVDVLGVGLYASQGLATTTAPNTAPMSVIRIQNRATAMKSGLGSSVSRSSGYGPERWTVIHG